MMKHGDTEVPLRINGVEIFPGVLLPPVAQWTFVGQTWCCNLESGYAFSV